MRYVIVLKLSTGALSSQLHNYTTEGNHHTCE